jgi:hypothetical protein
MTARKDSTYSNYRWHGSSILRQAKATSEIYHTDRQPKGSGGGMGFIDAISYCLTLSQQVLV